MNLTERQREVATLISRGFDDKTIARELGIGACTAKVHVRAVLDRLGVPNRILAAVTWDRLTR